MTEPKTDFLSPHIRMRIQPVPRRGTLMVVAVVLFIAWFAVGFAPWQFGFAVAALIGVGAAQLAGWVPAI